jgi:hypothetical protein
LLAFLVASPVAPALSSRDLPLAGWAVYVDEGDDADSGTIWTVASVNGRTYVGGEFDRIALATGPLAALSRITGEPLPGAPHVWGEYVSAIVSDGKGGFYLGGEFEAAGDVQCRNLVHVRPDGSVAPDWCPRPDGPVYEIVRSREMLYVVGLFDRVGGKGRQGIAAVDADSGRVTRWHPRVYWGAETLAVRGDTVYLGGTFTSVNGRVRVGLAAVDGATGKLRPWNPAREVPIDARLDEPAITFHDLAVGSGRVYVAGLFLRIGRASRCGIAAFDPVDGRLLPWNPDRGCSTRGATYAVATAGSRVYVGGAFERIGGKKRAGLAAVARDGTILPWRPQRRDGVTNHIATTGTAVYALARDEAAVTAFNVRTGSQLGPPLAQPEDEGALTSIDAIEPIGDRLLVGGRFSSFDAIERHNLAAIDQQSGEITSWAPATDGAVYALVASGAAVYAGGGFSEVGGIQRPLVAALDGSSGAVLPWNASATAGGGSESAVNALGLSGQTLYVGGQFTTMGGAERENLAAIDAATGLATPFRADVAGQGADTRVHAVAASGGRLYAGGYFRTVNSDNRLRRWRVHQCGGRGAHRDRRHRRFDGWRDALGAAA